MPTQVLSVVVAERYRLDARLVGLTLTMDTALAFLLMPLLAGAAQHTAALVY
jgi:predicted permease